MRARDRALRLLSALSFFILENSRDDAAEVIVISRCYDKLLMLVPSAAQHTNEDTLLLATSVRHRAYRAHAKRTFNAVKEALGRLPD